MTERAPSNRQRARKLKLFWRRRPTDPEPRHEPGAAELDQATRQGEGLAGPDPLASEATTAKAMEAGLEKSRTGFIGRLRGFLAGGPAPAWDDVEETLIAGDVGAALAMDVVERARRQAGSMSAEEA